MQRPNRSKPAKVGWRAPEFAEAAGIGVAFVNKMIKEGTIDSVKIGGARIIRTSPSELLARGDKGGDL